jgi:hypothetical protein
MPTLEVGWFDLKKPRQLAEASFQQLMMNGELMKTARGDLNPGGVACL